jgi:hypothetical protein
MFVWFAAMSFVIITVVFASAAVDYRLIMLGAVLPLAEGAIGGPWLLHTMLGSIVLFAAVMLATRGRRIAGRRWVGLPIGVFLHLVLDGTWTNAKLFWWPFLGRSALGHGRVPELQHLGVSLTLEVIGVGVAVWSVRRFGLLEADARRRFIRTGQLPRELFR